jgi:hypothetical protein
MRALQMFEDLLYEYNRNIRDYQDNIRRIGRHIENIGQNRSSVVHNPPHMSFSYQGLFVPPGRPFSFPSLPLSEDQIAASTRTFAYTREDSEQLTCPISLEAFQEGDTLCEILACRHVFKKVHLLHWLERSGSCPVCRHAVAQRPVVAPPEMQDPSGALLYELNIPLELLASLFHPMTSENDVEVPDVD